MDHLNEEKSSVGALVQIFRDAFKLSLELFKIMVPVIILVKILQEFDLIKYLAIALSPVMTVVGLPGEMGLVWATAIFNNLYGAIIVLLSLVDDTPITAAQATVLCSMMLVAHSLPVELRIAQASGPRLIFQAVSRMGSAMFLGWFLHIFYSYFALFQKPVTILLKPDVYAALHNKNLYSWAVGEVRNLLSIFLVILGLLLIMRILNKLRIIDFLNRVLRPVLKVMGIGPKASTIAVIGLTLGISYGGGLIIHEARSGHIDKKDVFFSLTLMGLSHSLIEDTLFMVMAGGHLSGLLYVRLIISLLIVVFIVKVSDHLSASFCDRFLWGDPK
ncbi:nucleoside recognition domain-containing protein [Thermodesulfobacteriota bacterium]